MSEGLSWLSITALVMYTTSMSSAASPAGQAGVNMRFHVATSNFPQRNPYGTASQMVQSIEKRERQFYVNLGGLRGYMNPTNGFIRICSIAKFPPTLLFRDQREMERAEVPFVDMRGEKEQRGDMF